MNRRHLIFGLAGALLAVVILALTARPGAIEAPFSPRNAKRSGARALGLYMQAQGWDVRTRVTSPADISPMNGVLLVPPEHALLLSSDEQSALHTWVEQGGRLVMLGEGPTDSFSLLAFGLSADAPDIRPVEPTPHFPGVLELATSSMRLDHLVDAGWDVLMQDSVGALVLGQRRGAGEIVMLPDAVPLSNAALRDADNLLFALQLLAEPDRSVLAFYARDPAVANSAARSEAAPLPLSWRLAGVGLLLAAVASFWLLGRRTGPILPPAPAPVRPLTEYVTAQAHAYRRADAGEAVLGFLADALRRDLAAASGLPSTAPAGQLAEAAVRLGVSPGEVEQLLNRLEAGGRPHPREVHALAAAVASLQRRMKRVR